MNGAVQLINNITDKIARCFHRYPEIADGLSLNNDGCAHFTVQLRVVSDVCGVCNSTIVILDGKALLKIGVNDFLCRLLLLERPPSDSFKARSIYVTVIPSQIVIDKRKRRSRRK